MALLSNFLIRFSKVLEKLDLSDFENGGGPPSSIPLSLKDILKLREARTGPIFLSDNISPFGLTTSAPFAMHRPAKGMSKVTAISLASIFSTIQSSAESKPSFTKIICTSYLTSKCSLTRGGWV